MKCLNEDNTILIHVQLFIYKILIGPRWTRATAEGVDYQQHHHHHSQQQHQQYAYDQAQGEENRSDVIKSVRGGDQQSTLSATTITHQDHEHDEEASMGGGASRKFKRICYGSRADTDHGDGDHHQPKESAHSTFVIPLPMNSVTLGSAQRPVIQFQHHQSPPRSGQSPSPSSSSSSTSSQNSRRDHNIDYSTLFVQLSGTFPTLYRCVNCHKTVSNRWHHANIHRPQSHACPICGQKFTRRDNMKAHCKIKHADMRTSPSGGPSALGLNNSDQGYFTHFVQM